jgi:hypothetical protein
VAVGVLDLGRELRKCLAEGGQVHHRVEAEAVAADGRLCDLADHAADGDERFRVVMAAQRDERADERGATIDDAVELFEQRFHVVGIALGVAELRGVVRGVDAR